MVIYYLLRPITRLAFLAFYRKIWLTGREGVPRSGPLILTANHPTAFVDPCFLACFSGRTLHFMTRGDVFTNRFVRWLLDQVHLIPIYRFHDGYANLRRNEGSFDKAQRVLSRNGAVLVMAEGRLKHEKRLRPIQKGAARIGFEAMERHGLSEVWVQPVALNYTQADRGRSELMADLAPAFRLSEYLDMYRKDPRAALAAVTERIAKDLGERVVHLPEGPDEQRLDLFIEINRNDAPTLILPVLERNRSRLDEELQTVSQFLELPTQEQGRLRGLLDLYAAALQKADLTDEAVAMGMRPGADGISFLIMSLFRVLLWLPHLLPVVLARRITSKTVSLIDFRSSILLGLAMFGWLVWSTAMLSLAWSLFGTAAFIWVLVAWVGSAFLLVPVEEWCAREGFRRHFLAAGEALRSELSELRAAITDVL